MKIRHFKDLIAWQVAHDLAVAIYGATAIFPKSEQFGLTSQMRRAAVSITSNIAEGYGRWTAADKKHFYVIAMGSAHELESQLLIAKDVGHLSEITVVGLLEKTERSCRLLNGLITSVIPHPPPHPHPHPQIPDTKDHIPNTPSVPHT